MLNAENQPTATLSTGITGLPEIMHRIHEILMACSLGRQRQRSVAANDARMQAALDAVKYLAGGFRKEIIIEMRRIVPVLNQASGYQK